MRVDETLMKAVGLLMAAGLSIGATVRCDDGATNRMDTETVHFALYDDPEASGHAGAHDIFLNARKAGNDLEPKAGVWGYFPLDTACLWPDLTPKDCDDGNECTDDWCEPFKGCRHGAVPAGEPCTADNWNCTTEKCDGDGHCELAEDEGTCECLRDEDCVKLELASVPDLSFIPSCLLGHCTYTPKSCPPHPAAGLCNIQEMSPLTGTCYLVPLDDDPCDDGNPCTTGDYCEKGTCLGSTVDCDDNNPCTADYCDEFSGCEHVPDDALLGKPVEWDSGDPCCLQWACWNIGAKVAPICTQEVVCQNPFFMCLPSAGGKCVDPATFVSEAAQWWPW
jgi:hypothetical protein